MGARILAIALNTYREAVRARVLHALLALALATTVYSLVVATLSLHGETRVVADLGAASISLYSALVAIVMGATSLYREIEHKTIFPILTRPLRRHEYLLGKYVGTIATLAVFVAIDGGVVLALLGVEAGQSLAYTTGALVVMLAILAVALVWARYQRVFVVMPWALVFFAVMAWLAAPAGPERQLVVASASLTVCEVAIVVAVATLFASFSSPALTAVFTLGVFLVGRSADTLANLPVHMFGQTLRDLGGAMAHVFPNLQIYVPPRPLLLGEVSGTSLPGFVASAAAHAVFYSGALLVCAALAFRRRDFQ
jgi:ABC-type transport system involved in multi-copper enzyme maturation permease subunit